MAEVYFYIPANEADKAVECGLKLSQWHDRVVNIGGENKKCISALLNPKDDMIKFMSSEFRCLKIEVQPGYSLVSDGYLYDIGQKFPEMLSLYERSIMPLEDYTFGLYRLPVCLITSTIMSEQISIMDKRIDSPVLFNNSEELYVSSIIENNREINDDFYDMLLYCFLCSLADDGKVAKIEDRDAGVAVFINKDESSTCTVRIPDKKRWALETADIFRGKPPVRKDNMLPYMA
ncbi:hypothetical protein V6C42_08055 [Pseudoclostridium thermosuccinogenes]|uniref:hypothetical protein n=1 Tax=Clostridium thermosuccinogenes TaxID=84032 RepID=UPI001FA91B5F|nr:hypothetical protein [Pseudoclostridium thermosuccinogenes]